MSEIKCEFSFDNPLFKVAHYDSDFEYFNGYHIMFKGLTYDHSKEYYIMFDVECDQENDTE